MFSVTIYEDGEPFEYYRDCTKSAINLIVENYNDLIKLIDIVLKSGHSIEILKLQNEGE